MHRQCYGAENFPNIIVLLKVDCFKGFLNWSNVDKSGFYMYPLHVAVCLQNLMYLQLSLREICIIVLNMY